MHKDNISSTARRFRSLTKFGLLLVVIFSLAIASNSGLFNSIFSTSLAFGQGPGPTIYLPSIFGPATLSNSNYILLGWNDLGMHCYNRDFRDLAVLPPYNTLWAQLIRRGDPPQKVTTGVTLRFSFPDNTYSVGKSNFWTYAQALFSLPAPLPTDTGLTGTGLSDVMQLAGDHFAAEGIPLTEFRDNAPTTPYPFQLARLVATDSTTGLELANLTVVAPVSTEMRCDNCHSDGAFGITTGRVETNILSLHDTKQSARYPAGHTDLLMNRRPILCAECHASNALGAPGVTGVPNLSNVMHDRHTGIVSDTLQGCYACHPGPTTRCLRDVMSQSNGMDCVDCHGGMFNVSLNTNPWLNEPRCDSCHTAAGFAQDHPLYRFSKGHGGIYCEGCHDSTHAIAPSREPNDALKFLQLQGNTQGITRCTTCHFTQPTGLGPHGLND